MIIDLITHHSSLIALCHACAISLMHGVGEARVWLAVRARSCEPSASHRLFEYESSMILIRYMYSNISPTACSSRPASGALLEHRRWNSARLYGLATAGVVAIAVATVTLFALAERQHSSALALAESHAELLGAARSCLVQSARANEECTERTATLIA